MKNAMGSLVAMGVLSAMTMGAMEVVALPSASPLVQFRIVFRAGAAHDAAGKEGTAAMTASMVASAGSKEKTYQQIVDAMYPMAARFDEYVDKELIVFTGATHVDNLEEYYGLVRAMIVEPGWRDEDLKRVRDDVTNAIKLSLKVNNDEELGKEVLYERIYAGHPYGTLSLGKLGAVAKLTKEDLQAFHKAHFTQANLILGVAGGYPAGFVERMKKDFGALPAGKASTAKLPAVRSIEKTRVTLVDKKTRSVAWSIGFPIDVTRGHADYPALLVASTWLGQHRSSGGHLYQRMREIRGLNYGDYSYIEYFPNGMFRFEPEPNLWRRSQIFQLWIRPLEPPTAHFGLRLALFELERFVKDGISAEAFETTRGFLENNVTLLMKTKSAELGYAIDSKLYGIPEYVSYVQTALRKMKHEDVQKAIRKHLRADRLEIVGVSDNAAALRDALLADGASPMTYNAAKPADILAEDKIVSVKKLGLTAEQVTVVGIDRVFQ